MIFSSGSYDWSTLEFDDQKWKDVSWRVQWRRKKVEENERGLLVILFVGMMTTDLEWFTTLNRVWFHLNIPLSSCLFDQHLNTWMNFSSSLHPTSKFQSRFMGESSIESYQGWCEWQTTQRTTGKSNGCLKFIFKSLNVEMQLLSLFTRHHSLVITKKKRLAWLVLLKPASLQHNNKSELWLTSLTREVI